MDNDISNAVRSIFSEPKIVTMLKADHRKVKQLFNEFDKAESIEKQKSLVNEIVTELTIHSLIEEDMVYPEIIEILEEKTIEAFEEHKLVKVLLADLIQMDGFEINFGAKVAVLKEMIEHHVEEEEKELLPKLKQANVDLDVLAEKVQRTKIRLTRLAENKKVEEAKRQRRAS